MQKQSVWLIWIATLAAWAFGSGWIAVLGKWSFWITFAAHIVEFVVHRRLFARAGGSMLHHFVQTLIYGLFHWRPIQQRVEAQAASRPAGG
jgi:hypothetical protein